MNKRMIFHILGMLLILEAALLLLPALVALIYGEQAGWYYLFTAAGAALVGLALRTACRPSWKTIYARQFGAWLAVTVRDKLTGKFDLVTWVPVSRKRRRTRGYDQAELLCRETARELGMQPLLTLEKCTDNRAQSSLSGAEERFENAKGAYRAVQPERFAGKRILLIDDIVTTGATMSECVRVLRKAEAAEVVCAALATPRET